MNRKQQQRSGEPSLLSLERQFVKRGEWRHQGGSIVCRARRLNILCRGLLQATR